MTTRVDADHYSIECRGPVVIIEIRNTDTTPVFDFRAMDQLLEGIKQMIADTDLATTGWHALYDFRQLNKFDMAVWPVMAKFARWTHGHGRQKLAHIFPEERNVEQMKQIKQVITGLIAAYGIKIDELYTASSVEDGVRWLTTETKK